MRFEVTSRAGDRAVGVAVQSGQDFDDRCLAELVRLADERATVDVLMGCPTLLELVPVSQLPGADTGGGRATGFRKIAFKVLDDAFTDYRANRSNPAPKDILAAGALMGLVGEPPKASGHQQSKPSEMRGIVPKERGLRQELAAYWLNSSGPPTAKTVRKHKQTYLRAFQFALYDHLNELEPSRPQQALVAPSPMSAQPQVGARRLSGKRVLLAAAGAVVVAVAVLATLYAMHGSKHQAQATTDPSASARSTVKTASGLLDASSATAPVRAVSVAEHESSQDGMSWAWASAKQLPIAGLNATYNMPDGTAYTNWYTSRGGTPMESRTDQIVVVGNSQHTTTILNAEASKTCKPPLSGTLVRNPGAGQGDNTGLLFNLDPTVSIAAEQKDTSTVPDYFGRHTYSLARGERATFMVKTKTSRYYCTYVIKLTVLDGTKKVTEQITDNGKPFAVTATIAKDHLPQFNKYQAVYLGGVESPTGDDKFKQVNPKTCTYLTLTKC